MLGTGSRRYAENDVALTTAINAGNLAVTVNGKKYTATLVDARNMRCPTGSTSPSGYGQLGSCHVCDIDTYANAAQTACLPCPAGTITPPGKTVAPGSKKCVPNPIQSEARKGAFRKGFEFYGHYANRLGADGKGRFGQGGMTVKIIGASLDANTGILNLGAMVTANHGEECNRERPSNNICICQDNAGSKYRCWCTGNQVASETCTNADCSCRDPGITKYYLKGTYDSSKTDDALQLTTCGNDNFYALYVGGAYRNQQESHKCTPFTTKGIFPAQVTSLYGGITDRNDWLFVPRSFTAKVVYEDGNTVLAGKFEKPIIETGNHAGPKSVQVWQEGKLRGRWGWGGEGG